MQFSVPLDHPALPGHFPGHPIVPGVVLLSFAVAALRAQGHPSTVGIRRLKFLQPVLPGEVLALEVGDRVDGRLPVRIWRSQELVLEGQLLLSTPE